MYMFCTLNAYGISWLTTHTNIVIYTYRLLKMLLICHNNDVIQWAATTTSVRTTQMSLAAASRQHFLQMLLEALFARAPIVETVLGEHQLLQLDVSRQLLLDDVDVTARRLGGRSLAAEVVAKRIAQQLLFVAAEVRPRR